MAASIKWRIMLLLLSCFVTGCGIRVEIAATPTRIPTPRPRLVRYADVKRVAASPRIIFRDLKTADALPFMHEGLNNAVVIRGRSLVVNADYEATWLISPPGTGRIRFSLYARPADESKTWTLIGSDSADNLQTFSTPGRTADLLTVSYEVSEVRFQKVRAEIEINARASESIPVAASGASELLLTVFSSPSVIDTDPENIRPALGTLNSEQLLLDWRGWNGGPCKLVESKPDILGLRIACAQFQADNIGLVIQSLQGIQVQDKETSARISDFIGYLAATQGDLAGANVAFQAATDWWLESDQVIRWSISSQNDVATRAIDSRTFPQLEFLLELAYQMQENPGRAIAEANYYYIARDRVGLQDLVGYFRERNLPQRAVLEHWLEKK